MHHLDFKLDLDFRLSVYFLLKWLLYYSRQSEIKKNPIQICAVKNVDFHTCRGFFLYKIEKWLKLQCRVQFNTASRPSLNKQLNYYFIFCQLFFKSKDCKKICTSNIGLISNMWLTVKYSLQKSTAEDFQATFSSKRNQCRPEDNRVNISDAW